MLALIAAEAPDFDLAGRTHPERPLPPDEAAVYLADPDVLHWVAEVGDGEQSGGASGGEQSGGAGGGAGGDEQSGADGGPGGGHQVVGELLCHLLRLPSGDGPEVLLYSIGVRSAFRRRGIGRALVAEMRRWMQAARVAQAWVLADNPDAESFYAACGFARGGEHEQGVLMLLDADPKEEDGAP